MRLYLYLVLGHLIGDFVLQSSELVRLKRSEFFGLYPHVMLVMIATALVSAGSTPLLWLVVAFVGAVHLLIDRLSIVAFAREAAPQLTVFIADQVAHVLSSVVLAWTVIRYAGQPIAGSWLLPFDEWTLALITGTIAVVFAGSIFVFECAQAVGPIPPASQAGPLLAYSPKRVVEMVERAALYVTVVGGQYPLVVMLLAGRGAWIATRPRPDRLRILAESAGTLVVVAVVVAMTLAGRGRLQQGG